MIHFWLELLSSHTCLSMLMSPGSM